MTRRMKRLLVSACALAVLTTGCIVVPVRSRSAARAEQKKCSPGHVWSDGACHNRGKGHDR
jgi:hypothetical protein